MKEAIPGIRDFLFGFSQQLPHYPARVENIECISVAAGLLTTNQNISTDQDHIPRLNDPSVIVAHWFSFLIAFLLFHSRLFLQSH
jgi:hypothetical protein